MKSRARLRGIIFAFCLPLGAGCTVGETEDLAWVGGKRLRGQAVVVTGGSRGLGLALAREFARAGARVALVARNAEESGAGGRRWWARVCRRATC